MSTGELLDHTFTLYKRNFLTFALIAVPAPALYMIFQLLFVNTRNVVKVQGPLGIAKFDPAAAGGIIATIFVGLFAYMLGLSITHAATIRAVSAVHLGRPISAGAAYGSLKGRYMRIVGVFLAVFFLVAGGSFLLYVAAVLVAVVAVVAGKTMGTAAMVVGGIIGLAAVLASIFLAISLFVRYALAIQACVIEDIPIRQSLKRSVFLAKGSRNRILTVYFLFGVLSFVIAMTISLALRLLVAPIHSVQLILAAQALGGFVAGVLAGPLATVAMSLVYYDERVRKEAFDLQLMMAAFDGPASGAAAASAT